MTMAAATPQAFDNEMAEILESFIVETREILEKLGQDLMTLEKTGASPDLLNTIFRAVHTVKGTSSFLGLEQMTELAHVFEDVLNKLRRGELEVTSDRMDVMFEAYDVLRLLLERIEERNTERVDLEQIIAGLRAIREASQKATVAPPPAHPAAVPAAPALSAAVPATPVLPAAIPAAPALPAAVPAAPATQVAGSSPGEAPAEGGTTVPGTKSADTTIRVDVTRLDSLMNLVGELVLGRNRLMQIAYQVTEKYEGVPVARELTDTSSSIDFITTELQMAVMKTRMIPIAKVFNKLPRLVRDLMKETSKDIDLQIFGEETELDKTIIEELNDPLVHIMRNAADHGIEPPADRVAAGKPARGTIVVKAEHEGNNIVITIRDDGRGMDPDRLKAKAVEKGIISDAQAREMGARDAFNLIFAPGFSTATKVTNVSGRGVGMDVVRTNITRLKGIVEIDSELGVGSTFVLKLPLTLAIIQALLVEVAREVFCVPLASVLEVVRITPKEINTVNGREVVRLRDSVLPLGRLTRVLGTGTNGGESGWIYVVVIGLAQQRVGIVVDSLLGQKEVVIKSLGNYLGTVPGIAGSTILGDGRVIMIIDVGELMNLYAERT
jgi:two-component system chemotaxis sensor kinase CheA